jgi:hypothetical protein
MLKPGAHRPGKRRIAFIFVFFKTSTAPAASAIVETTLQVLASLKAATAETLSEECPRRSRPL